MVCSGASAVDHPELHRQLYMGTLYLELANLHGSSLFRQLLCPIAAISFVSGRNNGDAKSISHSMCGSVDPTYPLRKLKCRIWLTTMLTSHGICYLLPAPITMLWSLHRGEYKRCRIAFMLT